MTDWLLDLIARLLADVPLVVGVGLIVGGIYL